MKRSATEHDHRVNDVRQATNQVMFGVPCVLDVKWRLVNSYQMARGWYRPPTLGMRISINTVIHWQPNCS